MFEKLKCQIKIQLNRLTMIHSFYTDYLHYLRWNYNNPKVQTLAAYESKILRQTHIIEKGMSLSNPRKGFGEKKIYELFDMLEAYQSLGYSIKSMAFQNAIYVLDEYIKVQAQLGHVNEKIVARLQEYSSFKSNDFSNGGIVFSTKQCMEKTAQQSFPEFFNSRHSIRQFSSKNIDLADVKRAVELAQRAPTACNRQAAKVYMYEDEATNKALGKLIAGNNGFDGEVRNYLVVSADVSAFYDTFERNQIYVEAGIFAMALVESLHYHGVASCMLQNGEYSKKNQAFKKICGNIPENERIVLFIAIGYYKNEFSYAMSTRKSIDQVMIVR